MDDKLFVDDNDKVKRVSVFQKMFLSSLLLSSVLLLLGFTQEKYSAEDAPGDLSLAHSVNPGIKNCMKCHNEDFEVPAQRCLYCHQEIAQRISEMRGYHQDKGEDCAVCHSEHQGKDAKIVEFDSEDFDHAETGHKHKGAHKNISDCRLCHRKEISYPRIKTQSYLINDPGCPSCHRPPHPGRQEVCLACHSQRNWYVDIWNPEETR